MEKRVSVNILVQKQQGKWSRNQQLTGRQRQSREPPLLRWMLCRRSVIKDGGYGNLGTPIKQTAKMLSSQESKYTFQKPREWGKGEVSSTIHTLKHSMYFSFCVVITFGHVYCRALNRVKGLIVLTTLEKVKILFCFCCFFNCLLHADKS